MKRFDKPGFRHYVHFFIALFVMHVAVYLVRTIALTSTLELSVYDAKYDGNQIARTITIIYSLVMTLIFCIYLAVTLARESEQKRYFREMTAERTLSFSELLALCLKKNLIHTAIYAAFQIPFLIFYSFFGIAYVDSILLEDFFCFEAGFYEITQISVIGWLMASAFFFILQMLMEILVYKGWMKEKIM